MASGQSFVQLNNPGGPPGGMAAHAQGMHGQQRGPQPNGPQQPQMGQMNQGMPQGHGGMHSAPHPAPSAPPTHGRNGPYGPPPPQSQAFQQPLGRVHSFQGSPRSSNVFGEPRPRQKVEVFDINDEYRTEADAREALSSYVVIQFTKANTTNDFDEEGYQKFPTWEKARQSEVSNVSKQEATRKVRELEREGRPVLEKREDLPEALQQQLDHAQESLQRAEIDERYEYILAQFNEKRKKVDVEMIPARKYTEYLSKHTKYRDSTKNHHKHGKSKNKSKNKYKNMGHFIEPNRYKHKSKRERVSVTAYFKRVVRSEESALSMLQEAEGNYDDPRFPSRPRMSQTSIHSMPSVSKFGMHPDQHRAGSLPNGQHMASSHQGNQGFPPPVQHGPGQHQQQGHSGPQMQNQNFQGPNGPQMQAPQPQHGNQMMPQQPGNPNTGNHNMGNQNMGGQGHPQAPQHQGQQHQSQQHQGQQHQGAGQMRGQPNGQPVMNQGGPKKNAQFPQPGQPGQPGQHGHPGQQGLQNGQGFPKQEGPRPPPIPVNKMPQNNGRAASRDGKPKPYVETPGKKPKMYPASPPTSMGSLTDDEYSGSESSPSSSVSDYDSDSDRGRGRSRGRNQKKTRPQHHGLSRRRHNKTSSRQPKVIVAPTPLRRSFGEYPVMETMWDEPWLEKQELPLRQYGVSGLPPRVVQGARRVPAMEPRFEVYEDDLDRMPEQFDHFQVENGLRVRPTTGYPRDDIYDRRYDRRYERSPRPYQRSRNFEDHEDWQRRPLSRQWSDADARDFVRSYQHPADIERDNPFLANRRRQTYDSGNRYMYH